jgi:hypothetical protein
MMSVMPEIDDNGSIHSRLGLTRQEALRSPPVFIEYKDVSRGSAATMRVSGRG